MKTVDQRFHIMTDMRPTNVLDMFQLMELAGRTCYKSEDKVGMEFCTQCNKGQPCGFSAWHQESQPGFNPVIPTCFKFVKKILDRGHESVIEHCNISIRFIVDRGISHELVRHRLASYSQESTRYCNYGDKPIETIQPVDFDLTTDDIVLLNQIERHYQLGIKQGRTPQQMRYFLHNGLKTEIVSTMNLRQWRHVLDLRTAKAAHPQIRALMGDLLTALRYKIPFIFDDIGD